MTYTATTATRPMQPLAGHHGATLDDIALEHHPSPLSVMAGEMYHSLAGYVSSFFNSIGHAMSAYYDRMVQCGTLMPYAGDSAYMLPDRGQIMCGGVPCAQVVSNGHHAGALGYNAAIRPERGGGGGHWRQVVKARQAKKPNFRSNRV